MKSPTLLLAASFCGLFLGGCAYDDGYHTRSVVVTERVYSPYGDYDEYSPYYSYSGRRYYRTSGRYVYYTNSRPYYVTTLPYGARYVTPVRRHHRVYVVNRDDRPDRNSPDWPR